MKKILKPAVFTLALFPFLFVILQFMRKKLGANPIEELTHETGAWALRILWLTLAITPIRKITHWNSLISVRRGLGLIAFFYAFSHMLTYVWLDQFFDISAILRDVAKRPFITAGAAAFLCMIPLALTSTDWAVRKLKRNWGKLHKITYLCAIAAAIHFYWKEKADHLEPLIYIGILAVLLGLRPLLNRMPKGA